MCQYQFELKLILVNKNNLPIYFVKFTDGSSDNDLTLKMALRKIDMNNIMRCYTKQIMLSSTL